MPHRALERAAAGRPDLHIMAADEQFRGAGGRAIGGDIQRPVAEPHRSRRCTSTGSTMDSPMKPCTKAVAGLS